MEKPQGNVIEESPEKLFEESLDNVYEESLDNVFEESPQLDSYGSECPSLIETEEKLADIMNESMGIYRNEDDLSNALDELDDLETNIKGNSYDCIKIKALILLAKACILSAIERKESRGAHQRIDYPQTSEDYEKDTCVNYAGKIDVSFK